MLLTTPLQPCHTLRCLSHARSLDAGHLGLTVGIRNDFIVGTVPSIKYKGGVVSVPT